MDENEYNAIYREAQETLDRLRKAATQFGENRLTRFSEQDEMILTQTIEAYGALLSAHLFNETHNLLETFTGVNEEQVLHNGIFVYGHPRSGAMNLRWCHLILLQSKHPMLRQHVAVLSQVPDTASIVNTIEDVVTSIVNLSWETNDDFAEVSPSNTTFVEHLGIGCFGDIRTTHHTTDDWAIMKFQWQYKDEQWVANSPDSHRVEKQEIVNLLAAL